MTAAVSRVLDDLDGLLAKATPGPWRRWDAPDVAAVAKAKVVDEVPSNPHTWVADQIEHRPDAALIVAAVNALPRLLAALRACQELAEELAAEAEREQGYAKQRAEEGNEHAYLACAARSQGYDLSAARLRAAISTALGVQE